MPIPCRGRTDEVQCVFAANRVPESSAFAVSDGAPWWGGEVSHDCPPRDVSIARIAAVVSDQPKVDVLQSGTQNRQLGNFGPESLGKFTNKCGRRRSGQ